MMEIWKCSQPSKSKPALNSSNQHFEGSIVVMFSFNRFFLGYS